MSSEFYDITGRSLAKQHVYWGYHLLIDMNGCDSSTCNSPDTIKTFVEKCIKTLKMIQVGEVRVESFDDTDGRGISALAMLTTSHLSVHGDDKGDAVFMDIFSCSPFKPADVLPLVKEFFNPQKLSYKFVLRDPNEIKNG